jgi:hypothetical protein
MEDIDPPLPPLPYDGNWIPDSPVLPSAVGPSQRSSTTNDSTVDTHPGADGAQKAGSRAGAHLSHSQE